MRATSTTSVSLKIVGKNAHIVVVLSHRPRNTRNVQAPLFNFHGEMRIVPHPAGTMPNPGVKFWPVKAVRQQCAG